MNKEEKVVEPPQWILDRSSTKTVIPEKKEEVVPKPKRKPKEDK